MVLAGLAGCAPTAEVDATPTAAIADAKPKSKIDESIAHYAALYDVPEALVRRSIRRESNYNPKARNGPYWGLMQIRYDTAKGMGYHGPARGLLDADTNLKYACAYLANANKVAHGDASRAIALYAGGYYYEARRRKMLDQLITAKTAEEAKTAEAAKPAEAAPAAETAETAKPAEAPEAAAPSGEAD